MSEERARALEEEVLAAKQLVLTAEQELQREFVAKEQLNIDLQQAHSLQVKLQHSARTVPLECVPTRKEQKEQKKQLLLKIQEQTAQVIAARESTDRARRKLQCCSELQSVTQRTKEIQEENSRLQERVHEFTAIAKAMCEQRSHEKSRKSRVSTSHIVYFLYILS